MDQAVTAWEPMLIDANGVVPAAARPRTFRGHAVVALRTTVLLFLAALAILVLLSCSARRPGRIRGLRFVAFTQASLPGDTT